MAITDRRGVSVSAVDPAILGDPNPGLAIKAPAAVATTGSNILLSGLQTIDGYTTAAGDRVLVKDQTDQTTNGIYNAATSTWTRSLDADGNDDFTNGLQVLVANGTVNADAVFILTAPNPVVLGTSNLQFITTITPNISIEYVLDGGGTGIGAGLSGKFLEVPFHCTVKRWSLVGDRVGNLVVDIWKTTFANLGTISAANSITGTEQPTLTAAQTAQKSSLAGWTTALNAGDWLAYSVSAGATVQRVTLSLYCSRP